MGSESGLEPRIARRCDRWLDTCACVFIFFLPFLVHPSGSHGLTWSRSSVHMQRRRSTPIPPTRSHSDCLTHNKARGTPAFHGLIDRETVFRRDSSSPGMPILRRRRQGTRLQRTRFRLLERREIYSWTEGIERTRCTAVGSRGVDTTVMAHLDNEYLVSVYVHAGIDVAGTEVVGVRHAICFNPTDSLWISE